MYYQLSPTLERLDSIEQTDHHAFAALFSTEEWESQKKRLGFPDYTGFEHNSIYHCKAENWGKYLFGSIATPAFSHSSVKPSKLFYYIREGVIAIIDDGTHSQEIIGKIIQRHRKQPMTLELFLYHFLSGFLEQDLDILESYESRLFSMEENALKGKLDNILPRLLKIRRELGKIRYYYEQLSDMVKVLETNEKNYFDPEQLTYFQQFSDRVDRLKEMSQQFIEYCQTLREVYQTELDHVQNKTTQFLTIITTIFLPLTVITGWYGMNFEHMPEIESSWGYFIVIGVSAIVILSEVLYLKKKQLL